MSIYLPIYPSIYLSIEVLGEAGAAASTCELGCGNGVVDHELGEECDDSAACCVDCRQIQIPIY